jgi:hypothetical protein
MWSVDTGSGIFLDMSLVAPVSRRPGFTHTQLRMHRLLPILLLSAAIAPVASAVTIIVDYSYDFGYFQPGSAARATVEAAAANLSARLADGQLAAAPTRTATGSATVNTGTFDLTTTANLSASYTIDHPSTGGFTRLPQETFAADEVRIYVGMRQFAMTSTLAEGRPSNVEITTLAYGNAPSWQAAINIAAANATALFQRGSNVQISSILGNIPFNGDSSIGNFQLGIGSTGGSLWFNPNVSWQMDHTAAVGAGENDLYSVALRQMMGVLGVGTQGGTPALNSQSVSGIVPGQRLDLTEGDMQALRDVGWITQIPEPHSAVMAVAGLFFAFRRRRPTH